MPKLVLDVRIYLQQLSLSDVFILVAREGLKWPANKIIVLKRAYHICVLSLLTLHAGKFFILLLLSDSFFQNKAFQKILSGILPDCQTVWIQIRTNVLLVLIWGQLFAKVISGRH